MDETSTPLQSRLQRTCATARKSCASSGATDYKIFIVDEATRSQRGPSPCAALKTHRRAAAVAPISARHRIDKIPATIASRCRMSVSARRCETERQRRHGSANGGLKSRPRALRLLAAAVEGSIAIRSRDWKGHRVLWPSSHRRSAIAARAVSLESLEKVTQALVTWDSRRMLVSGRRMERNGHNPAFARELARYFRNLIGVAPSPRDSRLLDGSDAQLSA